MAKITKVHFIEIDKTKFIPIESIYQIEYESVIERLNILCDSENFYINGLENSIIFLQGYFRIVGKNKMLSLLNDKNIDSGSDVKNFKTSRG